MKRKLIVVDTETGGLDADTHSIVSFAAVVYHGGSLENTFHTYIRDGEGLTTEEAWRTNKIAQAQLADAPNPWAAVQLFKQWLLKNELYGQQTLCAHGATFDSSFLRRLWRLAGERYEDQFTHRTLCTQTAALLLEQAERINLPGGSASLDNVAAVFGLKREGMVHDALEDATLCGKILNKMVQRLK